MYGSAARTRRKALYNAGSSVVQNTLLPTSKTSPSKLPFLGSTSRRHRRLVSASLAPAGGHHNPDKYVTLIQTSQDAPQGTFSANSFPNRDNPKAWLAILDTYLPKELRLKPHNETCGSCENPKLQPICSLPFLLSTSRGTTPLKLDLLSYLGVHQSRWDSVIWLVKELLKLSRGDGDSEMRAQRSPWEYETARSQSLGDMSSDHILFEARAFSGLPFQSLDKTTENGSPSALPQDVKGLGQVWASTASMILEATDRPMEDPNQQIIMSKVLEILAHLHHIDALPSTIYSYNHARDPSVTRKPPTLYLLAYRVMTILSDSAWKAHDKEVRKQALSAGARDWYKGHEIEGPTIQPRVNTLGTEVWLDLVLWCCVEGGWITEAAWIVREMAKRKGNLKWHAIDWNSIREQPEPKLNWSARVELEIARSRMNQIARGIGIAGQSGAPPAVEMGHRTISQEVILALMDALTNTINPTSPENSATMIVRSLGACREILGRNYASIEESILNRSILSVVESGMIDPQRTPQDLERILEMAPSHRTKSGGESSSMQTAPPVHLYGEESSAACIGLLHETLHYFAVHGNLQGTLRSFRKMQALVDDNRRRSILGFAEHLKRREREHNSRDELFSESINNLLPGVYPQMPAHVLASWLDLITQTAQHELGEWLLYSDEVDGPLIPPSLYSEEGLQPALLRFAEATADGELFSNVSAKLKPPLSPDIMRVLLHCQIRLEKWDAAEEIIVHFQNDRDIGLLPGDIMAVARAILRLEQIAPEQTLDGALDISRSLGRARSLLQDILQGRYSRSRDPSGPRDYSDIRILSQIGRILRSVPGSLARIPLHPFGGVGRANAPISISTVAFNILLEGVVDAHGSFQGRKTWDLWCRHVGDRTRRQPDVYPDTDSLELVVDPSLQTLRIVMRPIVKAQKARDQQEASLVSWAVDKYQCFGLTSKEIQNELPGLAAMTTPGNKSPLEDSA